MGKKNPLHPLFQIALTDVNKFEKEKKKSSREEILQNATLLVLKAVVCNVIDL